jgi:hypothetical protein
MMLRVACSAPTSPPLTGASTTVTPAGSSRTPRSRTATGETVPITTSTLARPMPRSRPSSRDSTSSTSRRSGSIVSTTGAASASSAGVRATVAPAAASSAAGAALRFQTITR